MCTFVLGVLETRLAEAEWIAGRVPTIADYALYPYTHWMDEVGFSHGGWARDPSLDAAHRGMAAFPASLY